MTATLLAAFIGAAGALLVEALRQLEIKRIWRSFVVQRKSLSARRVLWFLGVLVRLTMLFFAIGATAYVIQLATKPTSYVTSGQLTGKNGENVIDIANPVRGALWAVRINGAEYDFRYWLIVTMGGGDPEQLGKFLSIDGTRDKPAEYGEPTFSVDGHGRLVIKGAWPNEAVTIGYSMFDPNR